MTPEQIAAFEELKSRGKLTPVQIEAFDELKARSQPAPEGGFFNAVADSPVGGFMRGLRDIPDAGAQLVTRGLEAVAPAGSDFEAWAKGQREDVEKINATAEQDYQQNWRGGQMKDKFDAGRLTGNIAGTLPLAAIPGGAGVGLAGRVAHGAGIGAASGAMQPVYEGDFWKEKAAQAGIGAAAGGAVPMVGRMLKPNVRPEVQALLKEGVTPTPGQILGGAAKSAEEKLSSVPLLGDVIKTGQGRAVSEFNRSVANRVLMPINEKLPKGMSPGREMVDFVHQKASGAYTNVLGKIKTIGVDKAFGDKVNVVRGMAQDLPEEQVKVFNQVLEKRVLDKFINGQISGQTMKDIDSVLGQKAKDYIYAADPDKRALGHAIGEIQTALRDLTTRTAPGPVAKQMKAANASWALLKRYEKAAGGVGAADGVFTPKQYRSAIKTSEKGSKYARGKALDQKYAEGAVDVLANEVPDSGTAGRALMAYLLGGGGAAMADPMTAGAGLLAASAYTSPGQKAMAALLAKRPDILSNLGAGVQRVAPAGSAMLPQGLLQY